MPDRFPQHSVLRDGQPVLIRPFTQDDTKALFEFFQRLPLKVRRLAWDPIEDPALTEFWGHNIDYDKALPLLALKNGRVVADATLHRRRGGPLRLVGRIKWLLDPEFQGLGLGMILVNDFISIARAQGLHHLTCMLISDLETSAIQTLTELGFQSFPIPDYGSDPDGNTHDMVKLVLKL